MQWRMRELEHSFNWPARSSIWVLVRVAIKPTLVIFSRGSSTGLRGVEALICPSRLVCHCLSSCGSKERGVP